MESFHSQIVSNLIDSVVAERDKQIIDRLKKLGIEDPLTMDFKRLRHFVNGHNHRLVLDSDTLVCTWNDKTKFEQVGTTLTVKYNI